MALYEFRLPKFSSLTDGQKIAVNTVEPIALSGGPGTGKSVVSVWRHIYNCKNGRNCILLTYTKTLSKSLSIICRSEGSNEAANKVGRTLKFFFNINSKPQYDEIIVDEAQDMPIDFYEQLKRKAKHISFGADDSQILYKDKCSTETQLLSLFSNERAPLDRNFRNSYEIMCFVRSLFPKRNVPLSLINDLRDDSNKRGPKPVFYLTDVAKFSQTSVKQNNFIKEILDEYHNEGHNIAILLPFQSHVDTFAKIVEDLGFVYSSYKSDDDDISDIRNIHVTTFKSSKGLEFDTVILPNFHSVKEDLSKYNVEENDYYVAVTRARRNLFLLSNKKLAVDENTIATEMAAVPKIGATSKFAENPDDDLPF